MDGWLDRWMDGWIGSPRRKTRSNHTSRGKFVMIQNRVCYIAWSSIKLFFHPYLFRFDIIPMAVDWVGPLVFGSFHR